MRLSLVEDQKHRLDSSVSTRTCVYTVVIRKRIKTREGIGEGDESQRVARFIVDSRDRGTHGAWPG